MLHMRLVSPLSVCVYRRMAYPSAACYSDGLGSLKPNLVGSNLPSDLSMRLARVSVARTR